MKDKQKSSWDMMIISIVILFSFIFLHLITGKLLFLSAIEEVNATVRQSAFFIIIPALIVPLGFVAVGKSEIKKASIVFLINLIVVVCNLLVLWTGLENAFDFAFYSAFSASACLLFTLECIIPKMRKFGEAKACRITQVALGVFFVAANIAFDCIQALNPQSSSNARMLMLIPLFILVCVLPAHSFIKKDYKKAIKSFLLPLPAVAVYTALLLMCNNGCPMVWNYRLIYTGGLVCIFVIAGYYFYASRDNSKIIP